MTERTECDQLPGRLRSICDGSAAMPIEKINVYRERWGLDPLPEHLAAGATIATNAALSFSRNQARPQQATGPLGSTVVQRKGGCGSCGGGVRTRPAVPAVIPPRKSMVSRAVKLAEAAARHLADDNKPTPDDALEFREMNCSSCPLNIGGECRGCGCPLHPNLLNNGKMRWRSESCPAGKWARHYDNRRPLVNPTRNLIFHIYPLIGAEWNWHRHIRFIESVSSLFNGKIAIGIVTGPRLAKPEVVMSLLKNVPVTDWVVKRNTVLAETLTLPDLLRIVKTDDPNAITFRGHTKGVTHKKNGVEEPWGKMMWATCMDIAGVEDALASHIMAGPMKCHEPLVSKQRYRWFYAGTFFWFRNKEIFERDWETMEQTRWYPEAWPGVLCKNEEAFCLCHDFTDGALLSMQYWKDTVEPDYELWKTARPDRRLDFE